MDESTGQIDRDTSAQRILDSLAAMLGWGNTLPQHVFEAELRALKARAKLAPVWTSVRTPPEVEEIVLVYDDGYVGRALLEADGRWLDVEVGDAYFDPLPTLWTPVPQPSQDALALIEAKPEDGR